MPSYNSLRIGDALAEAKYLPASALSQLFFVNAKLHASAENVRTHVSKLGRREVLL